MAIEYFDAGLVLAAEDFSDELFEQYHTFSEYEDRIIRKLISHGPVLIRGGRGSGKSALLKEAYFRSNKSPISETTLGVYLSLRYLPLLKYEDRDYETFFCKLLTDYVKGQIQKSYGCEFEFGFDPNPDISDVQRELTKLSTTIQRRIVFFFDDAAHIGRERSLKDFFDIFRTLSSNSISCKAAIYPGVTEFGTRFDLLNDASLIDINRNEESISFTEFFCDILQKRYSDTLPRNAFSKKVTFREFACFMGRAVTGNVRAFIFGCNHLSEERSGLISLLDIEKTLKFLASDYYWPLLDEVKPKLGCYEPLIDPARILAEKIFKLVSDSITSNSSYGPSCLIHRDHIERLKKLFEVLEYVGFIVKRDASRAMKSGGRGTRYVLNLCNLIEILSSSRLTHGLFTRWISHEKEYAQIFRGGDIDNIRLPDLSDKKELDILNNPISVLRKSKAYPYGLTENKVLTLLSAEVDTVGQLAEMKDENLLKLEGIGPEWLKRIRNVQGQAIWM